MSLPPFRTYAVLWLALALVLGGAAWGWWRHAWIAVVSGVVLGFVGLAILIAMSGRPKEPGPRDPGDPRA